MLPFSTPSTPELLALVRILCGIPWERVTCSWLLVAHLVCVCVLIFRESEPLFGERTASTISDFLNVRCTVATFQ